MRRVISFATVKRVVGFAIVAVGVSILFLNVSADVTGGYDGSVMHQADCGSVWQAMLTGENNYGRECHMAAFPHVWIAGGAAAIGMAVAFWGAGRRLLLGMVGLVVLITLLIAAILRVWALVQSFQPFGGD